MQNVWQVFDEAPQHGMKDESRLLEKAYISSVSLAGSSLCQTVVPEAQV